MGEEKEGNCLTAEVWWCLTELHMESLQRKFYQLKGNMTLILRALVVGFYSNCLGHSYLTDYKISSNNICKINMLLYREK